MDDLELQELDEGYRQDLALAVSHSRRRRLTGGESEHPVLHLLTHPEARAELKGESLAENNSSI